MFETLMYGAKSAIRDWWLLVSTPRVIVPILLVSVLVSLVAVWRGW